MGPCLAENTAVDMVDGRLTPDAHAAAAAHIDECESCRTFLAGVARSEQHKSKLETSSTDLVEPSYKDAWEPPQLFDSFQLLRFVGQGQMGRVYEAQDLELDRIVAVKFLSVIGESGPSRERFRIEARAIARVQHSGVMQVFRTGEAGGHPYLVSEFVRGMSLDKVPRPAPWQEALRIGQALAAALAAAHQRGVLHRDIKPANIMLTSDGGIKLLDFGLAKLLGSNSDDAAAFVRDPARASAVIDSLTSTGTLVGTPRYMAPELWAGELASERSDIYALGSVLYELCSGRPPYPAASLDELRRQMRDETPLPLERLVLRIDKRFASVVDRCLSRNPVQRPPSGEALSSALAKVSLSSGLRSRVGANPMLSTVVAATAITLIIGAYWGDRTLNLESRVVREHERSISLPVRQSIAVLGFDNETGQEALGWFDTALVEALHGGLSLGEHVRLISTDSVTTLRRELKLRQFTKLDHVIWQRVRRFLGADQVILGSYAMVPQSSQVQLTVMLVDVAHDGKLLSRLSETFVREDILEAALKVSNHFRARFGAPGSAVHDLMELRAALPRDPHAVEQYLKGIALNRALQSDQARALLEQAAIEHPSEPLLHSALAHMWRTVGDDVRERAEALSAYKLADDLPEEAALQIKGDYLRTARQFGQAAKVYEKLYLAKPDVVEYALGWLENQYESYENDRGLAAIKVVERNTPNATEFPSIRIVRGNIFKSTPGMLPAALQEFQLAVAAAREQGSISMTAWARLREAHVRIRLGQTDEAKSIVDEVTPFFQSHGLYHELRIALYEKATILTVQRQFSRAAIAYKEAIEVSKKTNGEETLLGCLRLSAVPTASAASVDLALLWLEEAERLNTERLGPGHLSDIPELRETVWGIGGRVDPIISVNEQAFKETPQNQRDRLSAVAYSIGRAYTMRGEVKLAEHRLNVALKLATELHDDATASSALRWLAELELTRQHWRQAERHASAAVNLSASQDPDGQAIMKTTWSRALAGCGQLAKASALLRSARDLASPTDNLRTRLWIAMAEATLLGVSSNRVDWEHALSILSTALSEVEKVGLWYEESMLQLMQVEALLRAGLRKEAYKKASILLKLATERHFFGIVRDARSLLRHV